MRYTKLTIDITPDKIPYLSDKLLSLGITGFEIKNPTDPDFAKKQDYEWDFFDDSILGTPQIIVYFEDNDPLLDNISYFLASEELSSTTTIVNSESWETEYQKYLKPIRIGKNILVKPASTQCEVLPTDILIEIDSGAAFGTGSHETTSLMLEFLEKYLEVGYSVLDIGTGSGILAIGASLLGASFVDAIDIDQRAVDTAKNNVVSANLTDKINVFYGDLTKDIHTDYDLIVANIIADVVIELLTTAFPLIKPGGYLLLSGILDKRMDDVVSKIDLTKYEILENTIKNEWGAIVLRKYV